jgi:hypothetical protein
MHSLNPAIECLIDEGLCSLEQSEARAFLRALGERAAKGGLTRAQSLVLASLMGYRAIEGERAWSSN